MYGIYLYFALLYNIYVWNICYLNGGLVVASALVAGDFHSLHEGTEPHGSVGLHDAATHTSQDARGGRASTRRAHDVFDFGGGEDKRRSLGGCLGPRPGDEPLVEAEGSAALPCFGDGLEDGVASVGRQMGFYDLKLN